MEGARLDCPGQEEDICNTSSSASLDCLLELMVFQYLGENQKKAAWVCCLRQH